MVADASVSVPSPLHSSSISQSCRFMLGLSVVPALVQFIGFLFLPESPRWLLQKGRSQEAHQVLSQIRGGQSIDTEFETIRTSIEEEGIEAGGGERFQKIKAVKENKTDITNITFTFISVLYKIQIFACLFFRRSCYFADPPPRSDSQGSNRWLWPPDVSAAVWDKHRHVGRLFIL